MKKLLVIIALVGCAGLLPAQDLSRFTTQSLKYVRLPWGVSNISIADGRLYCVSNGVVLSSALTADGLISLLPDTVVGRFDERVDYVAQNPRDGYFYYTVADRSGNQRLMCHRGDKGRSERRVDLGGWSAAVNHPAFSPDGNMMIFSSQAKVGMGGADLWCSLWNGRKWNKPINMGSVINTGGNEVRPSFYGNYLIFSSDRGGSAYQLYSVRVNSGTKADDIIFGNYLVQPLPEPLNGRGDNMDVAVDTLTRRGYWLSTRGGKNEIYTFSGRIDGMLLSGRVVGESEAPVAGADVKAFYHGREVASTTTDVSGEYSLFLQPDLTYQIKVSKADYYNFSRNVSAMRRQDKCLLAVDSMRVVLKTLRLAYPIKLEGLFGEGTAVELSAKDIESLQYIVDFVRSNPKIRTNFLFYYEQTPDVNFNNMITERRINGLREYMQSVLPKDSPILYQNANNTDENEAQQTGVNAIFVIFNK